VEDFGRSLRLDVPSESERIRVSHFSDPRLNLFPALPSQTFVVRIESLDGAVTREAVMSTRKGEAFAAATAAIAYCSEDPTLRIRNVSVVPFAGKPGERRVLYDPSQDR
jgi:hypothetical protein